MRTAAGPVFVEASDFAELSAAPLMGYELAHNLNLQHDSLEIANLLALFCNQSGVETGLMIPLRLTLESA